MHGRVQYAYTVYGKRCIIFLLLCNVYGDMGDLKLKYVNGEIGRDEKKNRQKTIWRNLTRTEAVATIREFSAGRMSFFESFVCDNKIKV